MTDYEAPGPSDATPGRLTWLDRILLVIVATVMFAMMALTFVDVFARYLFAGSCGASSFAGSSAGFSCFAAFSSSQSSRRTSSRSRLMSSTTLRASAATT